MIDSIRGATAASAAALLAALLSVSAPCGGAGAHADDQARVWAIDVGGCLHVRAGSICDTGAETVLHLWIPEGGAPQISVGGMAVPALPTGRPGGNGRRYDVPVLAGATWLEVRDQTARHLPYRLALQAAPSEPTVARAVELRAAGKSDQAETLLRSAMSRLRDPERARAQALRARLDLDRGDVDAAIAGLRTAAALARAQGRLSEAVDDACALAFALGVYQLRFSDARAVLEDAAPLAMALPEGRVRLGYQAGLIRSNIGDLRGALGNFRWAVEEAARLGMTRDEAAGRQELADTTARLGRTAEALALQKEVVERTPPTTDPCQRAEPLIELSWYAILDAETVRRDGGRRSGPEPDASAASADRTAAAALADADLALRGCPDMFSLRVNLTNHALHALAVGDLAGARRRLDQLRGQPGTPPQNLAAWELEVEARLATAADRPARALALFEKEEAIAQHQEYLDGIFRARVGAGAALRALGNPTAAARSFERAEELLEASVAEVPLGEGRDAFAGMRDDSARLLVEALLAAGDLPGVLRAARWARARLLALAAAPDRIAALPPEQRVAWEDRLARYRRLRRQLEEEVATERLAPLAERPARRERRLRQSEVLKSVVDDLQRMLRGNRDRRTPELRPPENGELVLAYFPLSSGWIGLADDGHAVTARALGAIDAGAATDGRRLSSQLLAPFAQEIAQARAVRFLPYGSLESVDLHTLPFDGAALLDRVDVAYGADLPWRTPTADDATAPAHRALLVGDPDLTLPGARAEVDAIAPILGARLALSVLRGAQATRDAVLDALPAADLFHFAGHGWYAGLDGMDSGLGVAGGERILVGDLLTLRRSPRVVVLSACESGRSVRARADAASDVAGLPGGWGLAQAFLAAGTAAVVAPVRPVGDQESAAFARRFYEAWVAGPDRSPAAAARAAWRGRDRTAAGANPDGAASFRVLVP